MSGNPKCFLRQIVGVWEMQEARLYCQPGLWHYTPRTKLIKLIWGDEWKEGRPGEEESVSRVRDTLEVHSMFGDAGGKKHIGLSGMQADSNKHACKHRRLVFWQPSGSANYLN